VQAEDPGTGELFPHVYGPIEREAIVAIHRLQRGPDQRWLLPADTVLTESVTPKGACSSS
jgi:uncharacterized protein (DUF952 family)